jgi:hypothetical protein
MRKTEGDNAERMERMKTEIRLLKWVDHSTRGRRRETAVLSGSLCRVEG